MTEIQGGLSRKIVVCSYRKFEGKIAELIFLVKALLQTPKDRDKPVSAEQKEHGIRRQRAKINVLEIQLDWEVELELFFCSLNLFSFLFSLSSSVII